MVRFADFVTLPSVAAITAIVFDVTFVVLTVNDAEVLPAAMVTVEGGVADSWLLDSVMTRPPGGAAELNLTVPVDDLPPETRVALRVNEVKVGELMVNAAD